MSPAFCLRPSTPVALSFFQSVTFLRLWVTLPSGWHSEIFPDETVNSRFLKPLVFRLATWQTFPFTKMAKDISLSKDSVYYPLVLLILVYKISALTPLSYHLINF